MSYSHILLQGNLQDKLEIPAEELEDIETVGDVIEYLREKGIDE
ncbi:hypothetical protein [Akkermansia sp.]